jgi:hypothetical protein
MLAEMSYVIVGILIVIIPGFLFSAVLYPERGSLGFWERTGASIGLGLLILIYEVAALARLKSMTLYPFLATVAGVSAVLGAAVVFRRGTEAIRQYLQELGRGSRWLQRRIPISVRLPRRAYAPRELRCASCGNANPPDVIYCIHCGKLLEGEGVQKPDVQVQAGSGGAD